MEEPEPVCGISQREFMAELLSHGIPKNDASLIGYGALRRKSFTWQNDEAVSGEAVAAANGYLAQLKAGIKVSIFPGKWGRTVWEVAVLG